MLDRPVPKIELPSGEKIEDPHPEWTEHVVRQRFLTDSWEGGECYRNAVYSTDWAGYPVRNLVRHKREYPYVGSPEFTADQTWVASGDDYELRRARTPVPTIFRDAIETHLSKIYNREIGR